MYMNLGFIVPVYSIQTFRLFNISVRGRDRDRGRVHTQYKWALSLVHTCATRHDSMRHDRTEDQDTTVFKFGATHTTTRPCD